MVDADAEVVAEHIAEKADGDAENHNIAVSEESGGERDEGRRVDESHATYHYRVAVDVEKPCKDDLENQRT